MTTSKTKPAEMTEANDQAPTPPAARVRQAYLAAREQYLSAVPAGVDREAFVRALGAILSRDAKGALAACSVPSIMSAAAECAALGLLPNDARRLVHIIPRGGEASVMLGYAGLRELALRSTDVRSIGSQAVHEGDRFELDFASDSRPTHRLDITRPRGQMVGVYAYAVMADGSCVTEWAGMDEIARFRAAAGKSLAWANWPGEMARKSVTKRLCKQLPLTVEAVRAIEVDNRNYDTDAPMTSLPHLTDDKKAAIEQILGMPARTQHDDVNEYIDDEAEDAQNPEQIA